jgi:hypothetical protein
METQARNTASELVGQRKGYNELLLARLTSEGVVCHLCKARDKPMIDDRTGRSDEPKVFAEAGVTGAHHC